MKNTHFEPSLSQSCSLAAAATVILILMGFSSRGVAQNAALPEIKQEKEKGELVFMGGEINKVIRVPLEYRTISQDGRVFAGFYQDVWTETISIHDAVSGKQIQRITGHGDFPTKFKFSKGGRLLSSFDIRRKGWKIWNVSTGKLVLQLPSDDLDALDKALSRIEKAEQGGADQPAAVPKSQPEGE